MIDNLRYSVTPESFRDETRDCTVHALANALGISYADAHACAQLAGRKAGKGMQSADLIATARKLG